MRYLLIFCLLFSGCASNIQIIPTTIKIHKHQWDKDTGLCWICGVKYSPMTPKVKFERIKNSKQTIIKAIMLEAPATETQATVVWEKYKHFNCPSFKDYLININADYLQDRYYVDFVERVKVRTKILKRGGAEQFEESIMPKISGKTIGIIIERDKNEE